MIDDYTESRWTGQMRERFSADWRAGNSLTVMMRAYGLGSIQTVVRIADRMRLPARTKRVERRRIENDDPTSWPRITGTWPEEWAITKPFFGGERK